MTGLDEPNVVALFKGPRHDLIEAGEYLREKIRSNDREYNADLRLIGYGLAAGYLFVIIARLSAMGAF